MHDLTGPSRTARTSLDLWVDGMRLVHPREHRPGSVIAFDLYLGDRPKPLRVQGERGAARGGEAVVRFVGLTPTDRVRLGRALSGG